MTAPALTNKNKIAYGLGQFAWASKDTAFHYFLFFYYTQFMGLSASLAGLAAMLSLIADAISDPLIGQISDNWKRGKWGRRHPFMIAAIVPYCAALIAIFNPPAEISQSALFAWYLGWAIVVRSLLTLLTVPHMALGAELTEDYAERTSVATFRNILGYLGGLTMQITTWFVLVPAATAAGAVAMGYRNVGFLGAAIAFVGMAVAVLGTRHRIPYLVETSEQQQGRPWYYAFKDVLSLLRQRSARILLLATFVMIATVGVSNTMLLHVNTYFYGFSSEQTGVFMVGVLLALLPASWLAIKFCEKWDKPRAIVLLIAGSCLIGPLVPLAHLYGLTPAVGTTSLLLIVAAGAMIHQTFYIAHLNVAGALVPDIIDEMELETGLRREGILNSGLMLTQKATFGVGTFFAGLTIDYAGFEGVSSPADVSFEMASKLIWVYGPTLALVQFGVALWMTQYRITHSRYQEIRAALDARAAS